MTRLYERNNGLFIWDAVKPLTIDLTFRSMPTMKSLAMSYKTLLRKCGVYTLGRFGTYEYLDQDKVVQQAMDLLRELANG